MNIQQVQNVKVKEYSRGLVSVLIPTMNRADILPRTLDSVVAQTYKNIEVVIVDDASCDNTQEVIKPYQSRIDLRCFRNDSNKGIAKSRNILINNAKGEYLAFLDDDDEFFSEKIQKQIELAESLDEKVFILCNGSATGKSNDFAYDMAKPSGRVQWEKGFFPLRCKLPSTSTWFFHRTIADKVGLYDERMERWDDVDYCLRIMLQYPVYMINEPLAHFYTSANSVTGTSELEIRVRQYFLKKHLNAIRQDRDYHYKFHWRLGKDLKEIKRKRSAAMHFTRALCLKPYRVEALFQLCILPFA